MIRPIAAKDRVVFPMCQTVAGLHFSSVEGSQQSVTNWKYIQDPLLRQGIFNSCLFEPTTLLVLSLIFELDQG